MVTSANTIKPGDASITAALREFWAKDIQKKVYENSISRNLPGAVTIVSNYEQGVSDTYQWTVSDGITTTATDRYDLADSDLKLPQVEYSTSKKSVTANFKGGVVTEREDIMRDQASFIASDIRQSIIEDLTKKENNLFTSTVEAGTSVLGTGVSVDFTIDTSRYGVNQMRKASNDMGQTKYMLIHPDMTTSISSYLADVSKSGDNRFLRENVIGNLHGAEVVQSTYITPGKVVYLGDDSVVLFERMPYTLKVSQDEVDDLYFKFAVKARFGMAIKRPNRVLVGTFNYTVLS